MFVPRESRRATIVILISYLPTSSSNFDRSKSKFRWFDWTKDGNGVRAKLERCSIWRGGKRRVEGCKSRLGTFTRDHALLGASYELPSHLILLFTFLTDPSTELRPLTEMLLRVIFCDCIAVSSRKLISRHRLQDRVPFRQLTSIGMSTGLTALYFDITEINEWTRNEWNFEFQKVSIHSFEKFFVDYFQLSKL